MRTCHDEWVEPCARLGKLTPRKILDAIQQGHLKVVAISPVHGTDHSIGTAVPAVPPVGTGRPITTPPPPAFPSTPSPSPVRFSAESQANSTAAASRSGSPSRQQFWSSFSGSAGSGTTSSANLCGGCGKEGPCGFQLHIAPTSSPTKAGVAIGSTVVSSGPASAFAATFSKASSTDTAPIWIDVWCRDRVLAGMHSDLVEKCTHAS